MLDAMDELSPREARSDNFRRARGCPSRRRDAFLEMSRPAASLDAPCQGRTKTRTLLADTMAIPKRFEDAEPARAPANGWRMRGLSSSRNH